MGTKEQRLQVGRTFGARRSSRRPRQDQELLELSRQILDLTKAIHAVTTPPPAGK